MKRILITAFFLPFYCIAQTTSYEDSVTAFIKNYVDEHEVVREDDKKKMQFFPVNKSWRVNAVFERKENSDWFLMATSGKNKKEYRVYGTLTFIIHDSLLTLNVYQSKQLIATPEYVNYLFIPFTDKTNGIDTYGGGRYIDILTDDIKGGSCTIDFNKSYNPYCAYAAGYNCPIPPKDNDMPVAVLAGEKNYTGH